MMNSWKYRQRAQAFGNLAQLTRSVGGIFGLVNNAVRVSQVNEQLAYLEQSYQDYNESLPQKMFDARGEMEITGPSGGQAPSVVKKPFGKASLADIEADEDKFFQAQLDYITKNTTNLDARREMIQHLNMKNIANKGAVANQWNVAADHEARASLNKLYSTVLASNEPWEVKVNKFSIRLEETERAGRIWPEDADALLAKFTAAAQYSFAHNGVLAALDQGGLEAAEKWLNENTPFWEVNPEMRRKVLNEVRQEWDYLGGLKDEALDEQFNNLELNAKTPTDIDRAIETLKTTDWHQEDNKHKHKEWLEQIKDRMLNAEGLKLKATKDAVDEAQKTNGFLLRIAISRARAEGAAPAVLSGMVDRQLNSGAIGAEEGASIYEKITTYQSVALNYSIKEIDKRIKDDSDRVRAGLELERFAQKYPNATDEEYAELVENIIKGTTDRVLNNLWSGAKEVTEETLKADKRLRTAAEKMTEDISLGRYVNRTEAMKEDLAKYAAYMFRLVQERYPHIPWLTVSVDTNGTETGDWGAAVLLDGSQNKYMFKVEDKKLVLYGYLGTRGNRAEKNWYKITSMEEGEKRVTAEEQAGIKARKEERAAEQEQLGGAAAEGMGLYRETVPVLRGAGKAPEIVFADWIKTTAGWYNKKTLSFATNPDLKKRLDALAREAESK